MLHWCIESETRRDTHNLMGLSCHLTEAQSLVSLTLVRRGQALGGSLQFLPSRACDCILKHHFLLDVFDNVVRFLSGLVHADR